MAVAATAQAITETFSFSRLIGVFAVSEDKDVAGVLAELEPVLSDIVVTSNSSPRSMPVRSLAAIAHEIFGPERVLARDRLDDAIEAAVNLADEAIGDNDLPGSSAVLVTGSVVTAGDARLLLAPGRSADTPSEPGMPSRHSFTVGDLS